jgi:hypothetical protein
MAAAMLFVGKLRPYVDECASAAWVAYLQWYLPRTHTRVTYVPASPPPSHVLEHDRILPDTTYPVRRDQTADTTVSYDTANIHIIFHYNMYF